MLDTVSLRQLFPYLQNEVRLHVERAEPKQVQRTFLDSTASTHLPQPVLEQVVKTLFQYANVHRGEYDASQITTEEFETAYNIAANLVNAQSWREIIFRRNATESINVVMRGVEQEIRDGDNIVVTGLEHNSNYVSWYGLQQLLKRRGINIEMKITPFNHQTGEVDMKFLERAINNRTKIVAVTGASNFMGTKPDIIKIGELAKASKYKHTLSQEKGSYFLVDGAQLVPGDPVDVQQIGCDFLAWSFHKMCLPLGVGGLYARQTVMEQFTPDLFGGDMVEDVKPGEVKYKPLPWRFTAGTPNILGTIGVGYGIPILINMALGHYSPEAGDDVERLGKRTVVDILMHTQCGDFEFPYTVPQENADNFRLYITRHSDVISMLRDTQARKRKTREVVYQAMSAIQEHKSTLTQYALDEVSKIPEVTVYGPQDASERAGLIAFNIEGRSHQSTAMELNKLGIETRNGVHCASLAHHYLGLEGSVRMSFYVYNNKHDVKAAVSAIRDVAGRTTERETREPRTA